MELIFISSIQGLFSPLLAANIENTTTAASEINLEILTVNNLWMMLCIALVFIMHLGFACVEAGFTQSKTQLIFFSRIP